MDITIVTALYDIRAKEDNNQDGPRRIEEYMRLGRSMLDVDLPMVIFTDSLEIYTETGRYRMEKNLHEKTLIIWLPFEDTFFYKDLPLLEQRMQEYTIHNRNPAKDTPLYVLLNNNKFDFMDRAMTQNPFGSDFFFWMDYGIQHCAQASAEDWVAVARDWPSLIREDREHIHQLQIHAVRKDSAQSWKDYFQTIYHHIGGSCFGGYRDCVRDYIHLFKGQWNTMLCEEGWYQLDEAVMTIITETHPQKFRFWYGDYDGLITNFIVSRRSWNLCFNLCQHYLDRRDYQRSETILATLDPAMRGDNHKNDLSALLRHLTLRITNDFYRHKGDFSPYLASMLLTTYPSIVPPGFIEMQLPNLLHYHSKHAMLFLAQWSLYDPHNTKAWKDWGVFRSEDMVWIPMGNRCLSALVLDHHKKREQSFPLDYVELEPSQAVELFRAQFAEFYTANETFTNRYGIFFEHHRQKSHAENEQAFERRVRRLYEHLETPSRPVVFFHTTERFLMREYSIEEQRRYDDDLVELVGFLERNFPNLTFCMLVLLTNRLFHASHPKILPVRMLTPRVYTASMSKDIPTDQLFSYREAAYAWYDKIIS